MCIAYSDALMIGEAYRASISYPLSWKNVDLRLGNGNSPISAPWVLQAFELSYRFSERTQTEERGIRRGYREDKTQIERGADRER